MRLLQHIFCIFLLQAIAFTLWANDTPHNSFSPDLVLTKTVAQLNSHATIRYRHQRDYYNGEQHYLLDGYSLLDFQSVDTIIQLRYQIKTGDYIYLFNGTESLVLNNKVKTMQVNWRPKAVSMEGGSFFYNSLATLRRTLPLVAADRHLNKELRDTVLQGRAYHLVLFSLYQKTLDNFGGFAPITEPRTFFFRLLVDKKTYLPYMLVQTNNADEHTSKITYTEYELEPTVTESSWYYSTYQPTFTLVSPRKELLPLAAGETAPDFQLPLVGADKVVGLQTHKNQVVLLEFWIRNCGPCIAAVPKLNALEQKYRSRGVAILAINAGDARPTVDFFIQKYRPVYPIADRGIGIAEKYGVTAFPVVFIIDPKGVILYSGTLDEEAVIPILEKALQQNATGK